MKPSTLAAIGLALTLAAGNALAADAPAKAPQGGPSERPNHFAMTDSNHDGFISKDEWRAQGDKMFAEADANNDGKISEDEMKAVHEKHHAEWLAHRGDRPEGKPGEKPEGKPAGK